MAAIVSGCYVASSNRVGVDDRRQEFGGAGWIVDPFGAVLATTSGDEPVVAVEIDLALVERAKREYPCYVKDLPGGLE
jgi:N-carbamoylputrescine amidase